MTVAVAVLAAGSSSRMGAGRHKLLARFGGVPLIQRATLAALDSGGAPVIVVLGYRADDLRAPVADLPVTVVVNHRFADGLSSSLKAAVAQVPPGVDGLLVHLADMPAITSGNLRCLIDAFDAGDRNTVVRATYDGKRGNPVVLPSALFATVAGIAGDIGARKLITDSGLPLIDIDLGSAAAIDVDTPEALRQAGGVWDE